MLVATFIKDEAMTRIQLRHEQDEKASQRCHIVMRCVLLIFFHYYYDYYTRIYVVPMGKIISHLMRTFRRVVMISFRTYEFDFTYDAFV